MPKPATVALRFWTLADESETRDVPVLPPEVELVSVPDVATPGMFAPATTTGPITPPSVGSGPVSATSIPTELVPRMMSCVVAVEPIPYARPLKKLKFGETRQRISECDDATTTSVMIPVAESVTFTWIALTVLLPTPFI